MTEIMVARRSGTLKNADGVRVRLVAGRTLAHGDHPAVVEHPEMFQPMEIALRTEQGDDALVGAGDASDLAEQLAEVEETAEHYRKQLADLAEILHDRGLLADVDTDAEGWLVIAVREALDRFAPAGPIVTEMPTTAVEPGETPVEAKATRAPRRRPTTAAASDADKS
jgi:hypothetical protein